MLAIIIIHSHCHQENDIQESLVSGCGSFLLY